ncbi:hypothetical protein BS47DRAFT_1413505 [Hydnum rufescens UP504]|uniref:Uncharacterized protein n=1 Tax=Hydnum rufescens UP504 TaxID=1448309 RepID=A0A9P6APW3_9AGAM|nr:hypothetical protein BS47DRAFT_1413505 [Hydnum rufescens UP504]
MDSSIPSTVGASSSSIVPSASSSRGTKKKFLSFKKKSDVSLPAPPPNPIELNDDGQPLQWQFGESLGPALPLSSANVLKAFSSMGKQYYHHFKEVQSSLRGDHPSSSKHFICIQDWVLEYNNTVHDSDLSAQLTSLLASDPGPMNMDDLSGLLFPGLPEFNPKYQESLYRCWDLDVMVAITFSHLVIQQHSVHATHVQSRLRHIFPISLNINIQHSRRDGALPTPSSFSKFHMLLEIIKLKDAEAQLRAVSRLLMHRTIDHIALIAGLELPRFGVDHALVGAFFSMAEVDFPFEELERHGVPLQGIRILDGKDRLPEHDTGDAHGEFLEIWRMQPVAEVKRPSPWIIKFLIGQGDKSQQSRALYNDLFESCLRDVDSHMAGALARVLGLVPLRFANTKGLFDDWNPRLQRRKAHTVAAAQADPLWDAVQKDLPVAARDRASAEYGRIVPMIQVAQNKCRVWRTPLEEYLLAEWTEWHQRAPPTPCIELPQPEDSCVASSSRVTVGPSYTQQRSTRSRSPTVVGQRGRGRYDRPRSHSPRRFRPRFAFLLAISALSTFISPLPPRSRSLRRRRSLPMIVVAPLPMIVVASFPAIVASLFPHRHSCSPGSDLAGSRGHPVSRMPEPSGSWHAQRSRSASHGPTKVVDSFEAPKHLQAAFRPPVIPGDSFEALQPPPDRPSAPPVVPSDSFEAPQTPPGALPPFLPFLEVLFQRPLIQLPPIQLPLIRLLPIQLLPIQLLPIQLCCQIQLLADPAAADPAAAIQLPADPATTEPIATNLAVVNPVGVDPAVIDPAVVDQAVVDQAVIDPVVLWPPGFALNYQATGLIGVRVRKNKMAKGAACNKKKAVAFNEANTVHVDRQEALDSFRYVLCPEYVQMCYLHQQSPVDLAEMMENAPPYRDLGDLRWFHPFPCRLQRTSVKTFLRYSLLELNRYPPIAVEGFTLGAPQIMDESNSPQHG